MPSHTAIASIARPVSRMPHCGSHSDTVAPATMPRIATTSDTRTGVDRFSIRESSSRSAVMVTTRKIASHGTVSEIDRPLIATAAATAQPTAASPISVLCVDRWIRSSRP